MAMSLDSSERHGTSDEYKEDGTSGRMSGAVDWDSKHGTSDDYIDPWCDPCENEGKYVRVTSYCPTCVEFFCKHCDRSHSKFQITKFHILKRGSDMPSCQAAKPPKYEECRKHDGKFKEYMCTDHRIMICLVCEKDHGKCSVKHATEISRFLGSADIDSFEHEVENLYKAATATKELVEINIDNIADQRKLMLKDAQTKYEEMISNCSQQLKDASDEINQKCEARVSALSQNHKDLLSGMMQINVILQQVKTADRSKMDVKSFIKLQALAENTRQQMSELHDMTGAFQRTKITFTLDKNWESFLSNSMTMGTVTQSLSAFEQVVPSRNIVFPAILAEVAPFRKLVVPNRCMESKVRQKWSWSGSFDPSLETGKMGIPYQQNGRSNIIF